MRFARWVLVPSLSPSLGYKFDVVASGDVGDEFPARQPGRYVRELCFCLRKRTVKNEDQTPPCRGAQAIGLSLAQEVVNLPCSVGIKLASKPAPGAFNQRPWE